MHFAAYTKRTRAETLRFGASAAGWSPGSDDGRPERKKMKTFKIENNKIYSASTLCDRIDTFKIVGKIPVGFFIWNIGENMGSDEYIPLCQDLYPGIKDDYSINPDTLRAIKLPKEEVELLREAAGWGVNSLETARKALKSRRHSYMAEKKRESARKTIVIFERITELDTF